MTVSTLYVNRPVLNAEDIIAWAKSVGFEQTVTPDDMHVTVAFSRQPVEWPEPLENEITLMPANPSLEMFGENKDCAVLKFESQELFNRWKQFCDMGASWDWPDYKPHITISYNAPGAPGAYYSYDGKIVLGPEEFAEVNEDWKDTVVEKRGWTDEARAASLQARQNKALSASHEAAAGRGDKNKALHETAAEHHAAAAEDFYSASEHYKTGNHALAVSLADRASEHADKAHDANSRLKKSDQVEKIMDDDFLEQDAVQKRGARNNKSDKAMIQTMHDHSVKLGADCSAMHKSESGDVARIAKIDDSLGLVFGYAIVCTKNGKPYYDLNVDKADDGTYKRVPEHIPEDAMLKAAVDFAKTARVGNEMHSGPDTGEYVFVFPMTADIAKAFGIETQTTGLMIAYKPAPEVFAKFKDGTYTGFSIEGTRIKSEERE